MVRLTTGADLAASAREGFLDQLLGDYRAFFSNQAPHLVTYYALDLAGSTYDQSLHGVEEVLGADSPVKFHKVENFPLYEFSVFNVDLSVDELGQRAEINGNAIVIPGLRTPMEGDLFRISDRDGSDKVYRVSDVDRTRISGRTFHQIAFFLYDSTDVDLDRQVDGSFETVSGDSGPVVVSADASRTIKALEACREDLQDRCAEFYSRIGEAYAYKMPDLSYVWDHRLQAFMNDNNVLRRTRPYRNETFLADVPRFDNAADLFYRKGSIIAAVESRDVSNLGRYTVFPRIGARLRNPFADYGDEVREPKTSDTGMDGEYPHDFLGDFQLEASGKAYSALSLSDMIEINGESAPSPAALDPSGLAYRDILKKYILGDLDATELIDLASSLEAGFGLADYILLPLTIYVVDQKIASIKESP